MDTALTSYVSASAGFNDGTDSPAAFLDRCLAQIAAREEDIRAFTALALEQAQHQAVASARRWRDGRPLSPIDGMPIGIKDIIETRDMPTGQGSLLWEGWRTERDAAAVRALRDAGAIILGKTATTEFAATAPCATRNPLDLARTPGGSSSGSAAAVAAGMVPAALGTQVVGSILRPASYCGCTGYKPSFGALNRGGSYDQLSQSCMGVLAASPEDAWVVAQAIARRAGGDPGHVGLGGPEHPPAPVAPRVVVRLETSGWAQAPEPVRQSLDATLERLMAAGVRCRSSRQDPAVAALERLLEEAFPLTRRILAWEMRWPLNTYADRDAGRLSPDMRKRLAEGEAMTLDEYRAAVARRAEIRARFAELMEGADLAVTLSAPGAAPHGLSSTGDPSFVVPASLLGVPALGLPLLEDAGLPLGLQLIGHADGDAALFAAGQWIGAALNGRAFDIS